MKQRRIFWQILSANLLILILTIGCMGVFGHIRLEKFLTQKQESDLVSSAYIARPHVVQLLALGDTEALRSYCISEGRASGVRITVIEKGGKVLADSHENPAIMELHNNREEVIEAMLDGMGSSIRYSRTLNKWMIYVAIPMRPGPLVGPVKLEVGEPTGVLRMSVPLASLREELQKASIAVFAGIVGLGFLAIVASIFVSRNISRPLECIEEYAGRLAGGDFSLRMPVFGGAFASQEVTNLSSVLDRMAEQLGERIDTIQSQRNELETVFSSMVEAVIAVDRDERVININRAAAHLIGISQEVAKGKIFQEVLRNLNLHQQVQQVFSTGVSVEDEIIHMDDEGERFLQTHIVSLNDSKHAVLGVLVVLNDVTRMRRLENVRRDFVANVSHELRTPITSIRGYVETLIDGAIDDRDDALQFLDIVLRQAERLNEIIEDLLALSRIEQEADNGMIQLVEGSVCMVLDVAVETCLLKAENAGVEIVTECEGEIRLKMNATLIEQALVNLLVNAIRYSKPGEKVTIVAQEFHIEGERSIRIDVIDTGVGIAANHLPRLFERFYRSDKARSRKQGGTGLGLAIVKHIALAHNGRVEVKSEVGKGSVFSIILPA